MLNITNQQKNKLNYSRYYPTPIRMVVQRITENNKCYWRCGEIGNLVYYQWECRVVWHYGKKSMVSPQQIKNRIAIWSSSPLVDVCSEELRAELQRGYLCIRSHCSIIHTTQKVEATLISISGAMGKQNVACIRDGILFSLKKENTDTQCNRDEPLRQLSEISQKISRVMPWFLKLNSLHNSGGRIHSTIQCRNPGFSSQKNK